MLPVELSEQTGGSRNPQSTMCVSSQRYGEAARFGLQLAVPFAVVRCDSSCGEWPVWGTTSISVLKDLFYT